MGMILGAWPLAYIVAAVPCGIALDRLTPRVSFFIASVVIAASAFLRGVSQDELTMFLAIGLFGLGGPLVSIGAPKLVSLLFEGAARGTAIGIYTTAPALGAVAAVALTNSIIMPLVESWRFAMFIYAGLAMLVGLIWLIVASYSKSFRGEVLAEQRTLFTTSTLIALLRRRDIQIFMGMSLGVFFVNHGYNNWLTEILIKKGFAPSAAGFWSAVPAAVGIVGSMAIPRLAVPRRRLVILLALYIFVAVSSLLMLLPFDVPLSIALILLGIARGSMVGVITLLLMEAPDMHSHKLGTATGLLYVAAEIGGVLGPISVGVISQTTGGFDSTLYAFSAVGIALALLCPLLRRAL
jgi:cyanate permease